jgi:hypothetical protein
MEFEAAQNTQNTSPLGPFLNHMDPIHILKYYFIKFHL